MPARPATREAAVTNRWHAPVPLLAALAAATAILVAVYPGFMSYDSIRALHEARGGVVGGDYPPFVSYVWRVFDFVWPGPALMLFAQNFLLVLAFGSILRTLGHPPFAIVAGASLFCLAPPILGPMLVVWKDVSVSACLCAAVACFLAADRAARPALAIAAGIAALFCGAAYRLNAITAIVPLAAWFAWNRGFVGLARGNAIASGVALFAGIAVAVVVVNGFRFPELTRLPSPSGFKNVMVHDLVAMSALSGKVLVPDTGPVQTPGDAVEYFRRIYDPRHVGIVEANDREGRLKVYFATGNSVITAAFLSAVHSEPLYYLVHRTAVFRELIGLRRGPTFVATHVGVDPNEEGVVHEPTRMTKRVLRYIQTSSERLIGKPWLYYLLGAGALGIALRRRGARERVAAIAVTASGVFYLAPLYFVTPAADVRYNHWALVCAFIVIAIALRPPRVESR